MIFVATARSACRCSQYGSILSRKCLRGASFVNATIATQKIEAFMRTYNLHMAHPFEWKKGVRFYKRLKAKIAARQELPSAA
jgi:hypothetical protein